MNDQLGRSMKEAMQFITQVWDDVRAMLSALEARMGDAGWTLGKADRIVSKRPYHILYQLYVPIESKEDESHEMFGVCIELTPPEPLDQALCVCVYASFSDSRSVEGLWNNWHKMPELAASIGWTQTPREIDGVLSQRVFTAAPTEGRLAILKLADIGSRDLVQSLMIEPLLKRSAQ